jgi:hypothetical protein
MRLRAVQCQNARPYANRLLGINPDRKNYWAGSEIYSARSMCGNMDTQQMHRACVPTALREYTRSRHDSSSTSNALIQITQASSVLRAPAQSYAPKKCINTVLEYANQISITGRIVGGTFDTNPNLMAFQLESAVTQKCINAMPHFFRAKAVWPDAYCFVQLPDQTNTWPQHFTGATAVHQTKNCNEFEVVFFEM